MTHTNRAKAWLRGTAAASAYRAHKRARRVLGNGGKLQKRREFLGQLVEAGDLCFDVGANFGQTAIPLAMLGARVVALEPAPEAFRVLRRTTRHLKQVEVLPVAAGPELTSGRLYTHAETALSSMSVEWISAMRAAKVFRQDGWRNSVPIDVVTLDSLIETRGVPAFIKLDVEGYELDVLRGLSSPPRTLLFEHSPPTVERTYACLERIAASGAEFRVNYTLANANDFALDSWLDLDAFEELLADLDCVADLIVVRRTAASSSEAITPGHPGA